MFYDVKGILGDAIKGDVKVYFHEKGDMLLQIECVEQPGKWSSGYFSISLELVQAGIILMDMHRKDWMHSREILESLLNGCRGFLETEE
jgi:hypothetical protein